MPKRSNKLLNNSRSIRPSNTSTTDASSDKNIFDVTNVSSHSNDDFLNNIEVTMNKRKKHLKHFYDRTFDADDNMSDDLDDCPNPKANKKSKSINTIAFQNVQSNMTEEINIPPVTPTQTTASRDLHSVSICTNTKVHCRADQSMFSNENHRSDPHLFVERSGSFIGADDEDNRALNNRLPLTQNPIEYDENQLSLTMNHATSHVANTPRNHELLKP
ncbi:unnamed protein product, partial [Rotaria magnacalcarata]